MQRKPWGHGITRLSLLLGVGLCLLTLPSRGTAQAPNGGLSASLLNTIHGTVDLLGLAVEEGTPRRQVNQINQALHHLVLALTGKGRHHRHPPRGGFAAGFADVAGATGNAAPNLSGNDFPAVRGKGRNPGRRPQTGGRPATGGGRAGPGRQQGHGCSGAFGTGMSQVGLTASGQAPRTGKQNPAGAGQARSGGFGGGQKKNGSPGALGNGMQLVRRHCENGSQVLAAQGGRKGGKGLASSTAGKGGSRAAQPPGAKGRGNRSQGTFNGGVNVIVKNVFMRTGSAAGGGNGSAPGNRAVANVPAAGSKNGKNFLGGSLVGTRYGKGAASRVVSKGGSVPGTSAGINTRGQANKKGMVGGTVGICGTSPTNLAGAAGHGKRGAGGPTMLTGGTKGRSQLTQGGSKTGGGAGKKGSIVPNTVSAGPRGMVGAAGSARSGMPTARAASKGGATGNGRLLTLFGSNKSGNRGMLPGARIGNTAGANRNTPSGFAGNRNGSQRLAASDHRAPGRQVGAAVGGRNRAPLGSVSGGRKR